MVEDAVADGCCPEDGPTCDAEARFFIAADSAGVPGANLEIQRLSGITLLRERACGSRQLLTVAAAAMGGRNADAEKDLMFFLREIYEADKHITIIEGDEMIFRVGKAAALCFLLIIGRHIIDGIVAFVLPAGDDGLFFFGGFVVGKRKNSSFRL